MIQTLDASSSLKEMYDNRFGYKSNCLYGSGVVDAESIIIHEIIELGNKDILYTMNFLYGLRFGEDDKDNVEKIMHFLKDRFGTNILYGKWLCSKVEHIIEFYCIDNEEIEISKVMIPDNTIPISDLGPEGVLWISKYRI